MRLELWPLERLRPNANNPRLVTDEAITKLARSIESQGFLDPIEARAEDGLMVAGHRRFFAAKQLGLAKVPVIVHEGMTDEESTAYAISNNRLSEDIDWNRALLSDQLAGLPEHLSPDLLGFSEGDMAKLFDLDRGMEDEAAPDGTEEPAALLMPGEVWIVGPVTFNVFNGLDNEALNNAEKIIRKIAKLLKCKALLDGDESQPLEAVLRERAQQ